METNYDCRDIYMAKFNAAGAIEWLHILPKAQLERSGLDGGGAFLEDAFSGGFFNGYKGGPYYAGFGSIASGGKVHIFFNDYINNADILGLGAPVRRVLYYDNTTCYDVVLDMVTGEYTRRPVFSNKGIPNAMPRLGVAMDDAFYIIGRETNAFGRNARVVVGRLTLD